jgi:phosphoribosylaminoimidazolecarboxamide formyltransferase/IMP cyclohydrolase
MKRALISVHDKSGLQELGEALIRHGFEIVSTGGTMKALKDAGLSVTSLGDVTHHPEILGGRVKTLHPAVFAGILSRGTAADEQTMAELGYGNFDIVVVSLYPFVEASKRPGISDEALIEEIDIGGPSLLRAASKNHARVAVVSDISDYRDVIAALEAQRGQIPLQLRRDLAIRTLFRTACYDAQIAQTLAQRAGTPLSDFRQVAFGYEQAYGLRYGENPHQVAGAFLDPLAGHSLLEAAKLQGKSLSYNNLLDTDAALRLLVDLAEGGKAAAVIVKHNSPCGAAVADTLDAAYAGALASDEKSAFGGIVALSQPLAAGLAQKLTEMFLEVVVAPQISPEAKALFAAKKNVRVLELPNLFELKPAPYEARAILGGALVQTPDYAVPFEPKLVTKRAPSANEEGLLRFAWAVVRAVKSNAIVLAAGEDGNFHTVGVSGGQTSRVDAVEMALKKAGVRAQGAVLASDAFFPFPDSVQAAAAQKVRAIVQPGGSVKDAEVTAACDQADMAMWFTQVRHFRH